MSATLVHRGPDSGGRGRSTATAGLAARRLAIIDLEGGDQPIASEDGRVVVVQNGEIYNHAELRAELEAAGHRFRTPHSRHRGARPPLRGARPALRRAPARDVRGRGLGRRAPPARARARPLRDQAALLPRRPGRARLRLRAEGAAAAAGPRARASTSTRSSRFLAFNAIHGPRTIFRDGPQAAARARARARGRAARLERYACDRPAPVAGSCAASRGTRWRRELRERLRDSVRAHLVADVPVGVLLSGGDRLLRAGGARGAGEQRAASRTFSIGFAERSFYELELARTIARALRHRPPRARRRARRRRAAAGDRRRLRRAVRRLLGAADLPRLRARRRSTSRSRSRARAATSCSAATRPTSPTCSRCAAGGAARLLVAAGRAAAERLGRACRSTTSSSASRAPRTCRRWSATTAGRRSSRPTRAPSCCGPSAAAARTRSTSTAPAGPRPRAPSTLARLQDVDRAIYLVDDLLVKTDRMSMAHSLELRVPFLDPAVAELALALPVARAGARVRQEAAAARGGRAADRARDRARAQAGLLDPRRGVAARASSSRSAARCWAPSACAARATSTPRRSARLIDEHVARREDHSRQLWGLMSFSLWQDGLAADAASAPAALSGLT